MALSQKAGRREAPLPNENPIPVDRVDTLQRRLAQLENAPARLGPKALETIVGVIENDLRARDEQWSCRLAGAVESAAHTSRAEAGEATAAVRKELGGLINTLREDVVADVRELESQGLAWRQEVNETIPGMVEQRVAEALAHRSAEIEARLQEEIRQSASRAAALAAEAFDGAIEQKLGLLREALAGRDREIADLRQSLASSDRRVADLLAAIGQSLHAAAERIAPAREPEPEPTFATPDDPRAAMEEQPSVAPSEDAPRFAVEMRRAWNLPLVSSLLLTGGCLAFLHWL
jgi:hypothetical protein